MKKRTKVQLPVGIMVGGRIFRVVFKRNLKSEDGVPLYGQTDPTRSVININSDLLYEPQMAWEVLFHEIVHVVSHVWKLELNTGTKEAEHTVGALASALFQILPQLVSPVTDETR